MSPRPVIGSAVLLVLWTLSEPAAAHAATRGEAARVAAARQRFLNLLTQRQQTGSPAVIPLPRILVRNFRRSLAHQHGIPRAAGRLTPNQVLFRQNFIYEFYRQRALRRGGVAGGLRFNRPPATPFTVISPINIFTYFPVFRIPFPPIFRPAPLPEEPIFTPEQFGATGGGEFFPAGAPGIVD